MKKSRYTEEQVAYALRLAESGTPVADVCRQIGIAEATFYLWKKKYGGLGVPEVRELLQVSTGKVLRHLSRLPTCCDVVCPSAGTGTAPNC